MNSSFITDLSQKRGFKVVHQTVALDVSLVKQKLEGYVELLVVPLAKEVQKICVNCSEQCDVKWATVNGQSVGFEFVDASEEVEREGKEAQLKAKEREKEGQEGKESNAKGNNNGSELGKADNEAAQSNGSSWCAKEDAGKGGKSRKSIFPEEDPRRDFESFQEQYSKVTEWATQHGELCIYLPDDVKENEAGLANGTGSEVVNDNASVGTNAALLQAPLTGLGGGKNLGTSSPVLSVLTGATAGASGSLSSPLGGGSPAPGLIGDGSADKEMVCQSFMVKIGFVVKNPNSCVYFVPFARGAGDGNGTDDSVTPGGQGGIANGSVEAMEGVEQKSSVTGDYTCKKGLKGEEKDVPKHMYTSALPGLARMWFPCVDYVTERCPWVLQFTCPGDCIAVSNGDLIETVVDEAKDRKRYTYSLRRPVSASQISLAVGPFEVLPDQRLEGVTHFCLPGLKNELIQTSSLLWKAHDFFKGYLGFGLPFKTYKQVFVYDSFAEGTCYAGMGIFNTSLLYSDMIIDQSMKTRLITSFVLGRQWFGEYICPKTVSDTWLMLGLAGYITKRFIKKSFGINEYRYWIQTDNDYVCSEEGKYPPLYFKLPIFLDSAHGKFVLCKSHLVIRLIEMRVGEDVMKSVIGKLLGLATGDPLNDDHFDPTCVLVSTHQFGKFVKRLTGQDVKQMIEQWVYNIGVVHFICRYQYSKRKNSAEFFISQEILGSGGKSAVFAGPMLFRMVEFDGTFDHKSQIENSAHHFDFQCHSKYRKIRRKKMKLLNGEEIELDLTEKSDSPILYIRMDPDFHWIRKITIDLPGVMWIHQMMIERDFSAHFQSVRALANRQSRAAYLAYIKMVGKESKLFYRSQIECAIAAAKYKPSEDENHTELLELYHSRFCDKFECSESGENEYIPKPNNFQTIVMYHLVKDISYSLGFCRKRQECPQFIVDCILNVLKYNDNLKNQFCGDMFVAKIIEALANTLLSHEKKKKTIRVDENEVLSTTTVSPRVRMVVEEIVIRLNNERLMPSYHWCITVACLEALFRLQEQNVIPRDVGIFKDYCREGCFIDVRKCSFRALVKMVKHVPDIADFLLDCLVTEKSPYIRHYILNCLFEEQPISLLTNEEKRVEWNDRIWQLMNVHFASDERMRYLCMLLFSALYGFIDYPKELERKRKEKMEKEAEAPRKIEEEKMLQAKQHAIAAQVAAPEAAAPIQPPEQEPKEVPRIRLSFSRSNSFANAPTKGEEFEEEANELHGTKRKPEEDVQPTDGAVETKPPPMKIKFSFRPAAAAAVSAPVAAPVAPESAAVNRQLQAVVGETAQGAISASSMDSPSYMSSSGVKKKKKDKKEKKEKKKSKLKSKYGEASQDAHAHFH
eukprot:Nk52_evm115s151 gene=Nk52_evmTU115s151